MLEKLKERFRTKKSDEQTIPEAWLENNPNVTKNLRTGITTVRFEGKGKYKLRVPGLRAIKRFLAAILLIFNFFVAQASLTSASASQPLALFFYLNFFVLLDYLWKTRRKSKPEWGK